MEPSGGRWRRQIQGLLVEVAHLEFVPTDAGGLFRRVKKFLGTDDTDFLLSLRVILNEVKDL